MQLRALIGQPKAQLTHQLQNTGQHGGFTFEGASYENLYEFQNYDEQQFSPETATTRELNVRMGQNRFKSTQRLRRQAYQVQNLIKQGGADSYNTSSTHELDPSNLCNSIRIGTMRQEVPTWVKNSTRNNKSRGRDDGIRITERRIELNLNKVVGQTLPLDPSANSQHNNMGSDMPSPHSAIDNASLLLKPRGLGTDSKIGTGPYFLNDNVTGKESIKRSMSEVHNSQPGNPSIESLSASKINLSNAIEFTNVASHELISRPVQRTVVTQKHSGLLAPNQQEILRKEVQTAGIGLRDHILANSLQPQQIKRKLDEEAGNDKVELKISDQRDRRTKIPQVHESSTDTLLNTESQILSNKVLEPPIVMHNHSHNAAFGPLAQHMSSVMGDQQNRTNSYITYMAPTHSASFENTPPDWSAVYMHQSPSPYLLQTKSGSHMQYYQALTENQIHPETLIPQEIRTWNDQSAANPSSVESRMDSRRKNARKRLSTFAPSSKGKLRDFSASKHETPHFEVVSLRLEAFPMNKAPSKELDPVQTETPEPTSHEAQIKIESEGAVTERDPLKEDSIVQKYGPEVTPIQDPQLQIHVKSTCVGTDELEHLMNVPGFETFGGADVDITSSNDNDESHAHMFSNWPGPNYDGDSVGSNTRKDIAQYYKDTAQNSRHWHGTGKTSGNSDHILTPMRLDDLAHLISHESLQQTEDIEETLNSDLKEKPKPRSLVNARVIINNCLGKNKVLLIENDGTTADTDFMFDTKRWSLKVRGDSIQPMAAVSNFLLNPDLVFQGVEIRYPIQNEPQENASVLKDFYAISETTQEQPMHINSNLYTQQGRRRNGSHLMTGDSSIKLNSKRYSQELSTPPTDVRNAHATMVPTVMTISSRNSRTQVPKVHIKQNSTAQLGSKFDPRPSSRANIKVQMKPTLLEIRKDLQSRKSGENPPSRNNQDLHPPANTSVKNFRLTKNTNGRLYTGNLSRTYQNETPAIRSNVIQCSGIQSRSKNQFARQSDEPKKGLFSEIAKKFAEAATTSHMRKRIDGAINATSGTDLSVGHKPGSMNNRIESLKKYPAKKEHPPKVGLNENMNQTLNSFVITRPSKSLLDKDEKINILNKSLINFNCKPNEFSDTYYKYIEMEKKSSKRDRVLFNLDATERQLRGFPFVMGHSKKATRNLFDAAATQNSVMENSITYHDNSNRSIGIDGQKICSTSIFGDTRGLASTGAYASTMTGGNSRNNTAGGRRQHLMEKVALKGQQYTRNVVDHVF